MRQTFSLLKIISLNVTSRPIPGHGCSVFEYPHRIERPAHLQSQPPPLQYIILRNRNIRLRCCGVHVRGVCFFLVYLYRSGEPKGPRSLFQKTPRAHSKRTGASFFASKIIAPQGAFTRIIAVCTSDYSTDAPRVFVLLDGKRYIVGMLPPQNNIWRPSCDHGLVCLVDICPRVNVKIIIPLYEKHATGRDDRMTDNTHFSSILRDDQLMSKS